MGCNHGPDRSCTCSRRGVLIACLAQGRCNAGPNNTPSAETCSACRRTIYDDPFIRQYIEDLLHNIRTQASLAACRGGARVEHVLQNHTWMHG